MAAHQDSTSAPTDATTAEVDAVLQAQVVHSLIRNDPAMPPKLRAMLVTYAGRLLDEARPIVLTPKAIAALERRPR